MKKSFIPACAAILLLTACASTKSNTSDFDYLYISKQGIIQRPLITDLEVAKQKIKITRTYRDATVSSAKQNILGDFITENNCDLVVQPYFTTSTVSTSQRSDLTITLTGYAASYKNIRQYEPKDSGLLLPRSYINNVLNSPLTAASEEAPKKKSPAATIVLVTMMAALAAAVAAHK